MVEQTPTTVSTARRISASPDQVFDVLASPRQHLAMDGSGMLRGTDSAPVRGVGDVFVMRMYFEPLGHYEMNNHVVEFEPNRRIAWEPESGSGHPDRGTPTARWGHRWGFTVLPDGADGCIVTEFWDGAAAPVGSAQDGRQWLPAMQRTLERLAELTTAITSTTAETAERPHQTMQHRARPAVRGEQ